MAGYNEKFVAMLIVALLIVGGSIAGPIYTRNEISPKLLENLSKQLPAALTGYIMKFLSDPDLPSPAPSLRRVRMVPPKTFSTDGVLLIPLLGVNDEGDLFWGIRRDFRSEGQRILIHKNKVNQKATVNYLKSGWIIKGSDGLVSSHSMIPLFRKTAEETWRIGVYNSNDRSVHEIGSCRKSDEVIDINTKSAIVRGSNHCMYWIRGDERIFLQNCDLHARLDGASNVVVWVDDPHYTYGIGTYNIQNFDKPGEFVSKPKLGSGATFSLCQRNGLIISNSENGNMEDICCHTRSGSRRVFVNGSYTTIIRDNNILLRSINAGESAVVCELESKGSAKKKTPGVISLATGFLIHDGVEDKDSQGSIDCLKFSSNGRWIAGYCCNGRTFLWEVRGFDLNQECSLEDRLYLREFKALYEQTKERSAQCYLSEEQFGKFTDLLGKSCCEVPDVWKFRLLPSKKAIAALLDKHVVRDLSSIIVGYLT